MNFRKAEVITRIIFMNAEHSAVPPDRVVISSGTESRVCGQTNEL